MDTKTICFIDDDFSASWGPSGFPIMGIIIEQEIRFLLDKYSLNDTYLKSLIESSLENSDFNVSAYANPEFFLKDEIFHPNYIIYDWDYGLPVYEGCIQECGNSRAGSKE